MIFRTQFYWLFLFMILIHRPLALKFVSKYRESSHLFRIKMSTLTTLVANSPDEFDATLAQAEGLNAKHNFILFYASENPATGKSWCPDCVRGRPMIEAGLSKLTETATLVIANVDREPYRTPIYPYRVDPRFELKCVPTFIRWQDGKAVHSLNDLQCQNEDLLEEMFTSF